MGKGQSYESTKSLSISPTSRMRPWSSAKQIHGLTLQDALSDLNDGYSRMAAIWIGLSHKLESVNKSHFNGRDSIVAWGQDHAVFIDRTDPGRYQEDNWGRAEPYDGIIADYYTVDAFAFNKDKKPPLLRFGF